MNLPRFIIIGSPRSGTTTLYEYFRLHPEIFVTTPKEPGNFAFDDLYAEGIGAYAALFDDAADGQVRGEASVQYTTHPYIERSAERIHRHVPDVKLIYIARHPVDRLYSQYVWETLVNLRHTPEAAGISDLPMGEDGCFLPFPGQKPPWRMAPTFERAFEANRDFFLRTSRYIENINEYLQYFPRGSLLVLLLDDLANDPVGTMERIYAFLGVSTVSPVEEPLVVNRSADYESAMTRRARLKAQAARLVGLRRETLQRVVTAIPSPVKQAAKRALAMTSLGRRRPESTVALLAPMESATRAGLLEEFREPNRQLADFLGRDLSHWDT